MKIYIDGKLVGDGNEQVVSIVFKDDNERKTHLKNMNNMPAKEGIRIYHEYPKGEKERKEAAQSDVLLAETGTPF